MNLLEEGVKDYILMKRAMGFSFYDQEMRLRNFCKFMKNKKQKIITFNLATQWALGGMKHPTYSNAKQLSVLRAFAIHWKTIESKTEVWSHNHWPIRYQRKNPYIFSVTEIQKLLLTCHKLEPKKSIRPITFYTIFGLIASCGLRVSEALSLTNDDIDFKNNVITIRVTKFNKIRAIPIHKTVRNRLKKYQASRNDYCKNIGLESFGPSPFFINLKGGAVTPGVVDWTFNKIALECRVRKESRRGPRVHDFRHTFVVRTIETWYSDKKDVETLLPILSTYVGHVQPSSTFWYMTITPKLMSLASERMDIYMGGLSQ